MHEVGVAAEPQPGLSAPRRSGATAAAAIVARQAVRPVSRGGSPEGASLRRTVERTPSAPIRRGAGEGAAQRALSGGDRDPRPAWCRSPRARLPRWRVIAGSARAASCSTRWSRARPRHEIGASPSGARHRRAAAARGVRLRALRTRTALGRDASARERLEHAEARQDAVSRWGESCSPAPISARAGACSRIVEAMPTLASASALARPRDAGAGDQDRRIPRHGSGGARRHVDRCRGVDLALPSPRRGR